MDSAKMRPFNFVDCNCTWKQLEVMLQHLVFTMVNSVYE